MNLFMFVTLTHCSMCIHKQPASVLVTMGTTSTQESRMLSVFGFHSLDLSSVLLMLAQIERVLFCV